MRRQGKVRYHYTYKHKSDGIPSVNKMYTILIHSCRIGSWVDVNFWDESLFEGNLVERNPE